MGHACATGRRKIWPGLDSGNEAMMIQYWVNGKNYHPHGCVVVKNGSQSSAVTAGANPAASAVHAAFPTGKSLVGPAWPHVIGRQPVHPSMDTPTPLSLQYSTDYYIQKLKQKNRLATTTIDRICFASSWSQVLQTPARIFTASVGSQQAGGVYNE